MASTCEHGFLRGEIVRGDYEKIVSFYKKNHPFLLLFSLHSAGGDVDEAIKIGRFFRKYLVPAVAPTRLSDGRFFLSAFSPGPWLCEGAECVCASACALIWFGAADRDGTVGLHRPRTKDPAFKGLSPTDAARVYRQMLDSIARYLDEMEAPKTIIDTMVSTGSAEIRWADTLDRSLESPPSIAEWVAASCGQFTRQEFDMMIELQVKKFGSANLTEWEQTLYKQLSEKDHKTKQCKTLLLSAHRDRLPTP